MRISDWSSDVCSSDLQLEGYAAGLRLHPEMEAIARRLSAADRMAVSGYYSEMPLDAPAADTAHAIPPIYVKGDPSRGLLPCADCHGPKGEGLGPANPALAGQPAVYLAAQLRAWRRGERRNDPGNVMTGISDRKSTRMNSSH